VIGPIGIQAEREDGALTDIGARDGLTHTTMIDLPPTIHQWLSSSSSSSSSA
jgi:hypothetical protein